MIAENGEKLQGLNQTLMSIENGLLRRGVDRERKKYDDLIDFVANGGELEIVPNGDGEPEFDDDESAGEEEVDDE